MTETTAIGDLQRTQLRLGSLADRGCGVALDDFGVGFSSFVELRALPVSFVKIGGAFVSDLPTDPASLAIVRAISDLAHALGKQVIAEEVEDGTVAAALHELGIEYGLGFHWGAPSAYVFGRAGAHRRDAASD